MYLRILFHSIELLTDFTVNPQISPHFSYLAKIVRKKLFFFLSFSCLGLYEDGTNCWYFLRDWSKDLCWADILGRVCYFHHLSSMYKLFESYFKGRRVQNQLIQICLVVGLIKFCFFFNFVSKKGTKCPPSVCLLECLILVNGLCQGVYFYRCVCLFLSNPLLLLLLFYTAIMFSLCFKSQLFY